MSFLTSLLGDLLHLAITVPVFGLGLVGGALIYRYVLKNDPTLLATLVNDANKALQLVASEAQAKAAKAVPAVPVTTTTAAPAAAPAAPAQTTAA
jgi:hypothetical protein